MYKYIVNRILLMIPVLLGVILVVYFIMDLSPVNPAQLILGDGATPEAIAQKEEELGLNDPFLVRYVKYVFNLLTGDMGDSWKDGTPVFDKIMERLSNTVVLAVTSIILALLIGIPLGIICAKHQNKFIDNFTMIVALAGISMPLFWLALMLVLVFSVNLRWLPSSGFNTESLATMIKSMILPVASLTTLPAAMITRMTRSSMLEVIRADYIDTARAKGLKESVITMRHMLSNALIPIITIAGLQFGQALSGAILTETVFSWPGIGRLAVESIKMKDAQTVLGCVVVISIMFSLVNLIVDLLYAFVDPRIKARYKGK